MNKSELKPAVVFEHFAKINEIPRPSKREEKMIEYLKSFGESRGLETKVDEVGNVIIRKGATPGYEDCKTVILQSHMDMVCDFLPDVKIQTYTPPKAENARIELYQEKVISRVSKDNSRANPIYKTQIREYKIIFNKPGRQVIEGPSISGIIKSSNKSFIQSGENQTIEVKPNPEHNLVSDNVTVHVQWTPEDPTVNVGQAITRSITLRGHNNAISQFPDLSIPEMPNYDIYVETTKQTEKLMKNKTFISTVSIKQVFVPKKNHDTFEIPDQTFVWMNPNNNEKKEAVIKGAQYEVSGFSFNDYIPRDPRYTHWIFMSIFACIFLGIFGYYSVIWYRERVGIYGKLHQLMEALLGLLVRRIVVKQKAAVIIGITKVFRHVKVKRSEILIPVLKLPHISV